MCDVRAILAWIGTAEVVELIKIPSVSRDPNDDKFVVTAKAGAARYRVTEDEEGFRYNPTRVPLSGLLWAVGLSRITAVWSSAPCGQRGMARRSWTIAAKQPAAIQRRGLNALPES